MFVEPHLKLQNMKLSNAEEKLIKLIWAHEKVFMKDLINLYPNPKPAKTTIATLLKRMQDKGFVGYIQSNLTQNKVSSEIKKTSKTPTEILPIKK